MPNNGSFDWSQVKRAGKYPFVPWEEKGHEFVGTIKEIRDQLFDSDVKKAEKDGRTPEPTFLLDMEEWGTNEMWTMSLGVVDLKEKVAELEPQKGDLLRVKYLYQDNETRRKIFEVEHKKAVPAASPFGTTHDEPPPEPEPEPF